MSRRKTADAPAAEPETQPETQSAEEAVSEEGSADEVKAQQNDQTGSEEGKENAKLEQIEGRLEAQRELEARDPESQSAAPVSDEDAAALPSHQEVTDSVADQAARDALAVQIEQAGNVRNAFVAETRAEKLDSFRPDRVADVRVLVESNDHLDRSGDNVHESDANKIVLSDGVDEARMVDNQPAGEIAEEFDLGNGIRQTNLK